MLVIPNPRQSMREFVKKTDGKLKNCIEIGTYRGDYAVKIYEGIPVRKLYLIDYWDESLDKNHTENMLETFRKFENNKNVIIIKADDLHIDEIFCPEYFHYAYIDSNHSYNHVINNIKIMWPKIKKGGMMAGHDYRYDKPDRVKQAVDEFVKKENIPLHTKLNEGEKDQVLDWWVWK